jgi:HPt (histidine-containing phosphotransfer) domain-containing protein
VADDPAARAVFDRDAFGRQTGGDAALRAEIIQMFIEDCPVRVEEIRGAVARGDAAALVSSAHALKGSAAYLSASIVRGCAGDLERLGRERDLSGAPALVARLDAAVAELLPVLQAARTG